MLILSLIIQPAAIGRSYRPAKFECPDTVALTNRFSWSFRFVRRRSIEANSPGAPTAGAGAAFERHLSASRRSRIEAGASRGATINPGTTCLGLRFAYSALRQSPRGRRPGAACGAALGPGP